METGEEFDHTIASELAGALRDDELWQEFAFPPDNASWREQMAARALHLYELTRPAAENLDSRAHRVHEAAGLLRELGDLCAIASRQRAPDEFESLELPGRADLAESSASRTGRSRWASNS